MNCRPPIVANEASAFALPDFRRDCERPSACRTVTTSRLRRRTILLRLRCAPLSQAARYRRCCDGRRRRHTSLGRRRLLGRAGLRRRRLVLLGPPGRVLAGRNLVMWLPAVHQTDTSGEIPEVLLSNYRLSPLSGLGGVTDVSTGAVSARPATPGTRRAPRRPETWQPAGRPRGRRRPRSSRGRRGPGGPGRLRRAGPAL